MGHATLPEALRRPDLTDAVIAHRVCDILYGELKQFLGFRRAMFGAEYWDQWVFATADEDDDIHYDGMIYSTDHFADGPDDCTFAPYLRGYRIVRRRTDAP